MKCFCNPDPKRRPLPSTTTTLYRGPDGQVVRERDVPTRWTGSKPKRGWTTFRAEVCSRCGAYEPRPARSDPPLRPAPQVNL